MSNTETQLESQPSTEASIIESLALAEPDAAMEYMISTRMKIDAFLKRAKEFKERIENALIAWIEKNKQEIQYTVDDKGNSVRLYTGHPKDKKCRDVGATLQFLLETTGGDWDAVVGCLSSNAVKHGAVNAILKEKGLESKFEELFEVTERVTLEEGKPKKQLLTVDTRFLK